MSVRLWWKFSPNLMMPVPMIATLPPSPLMEPSSGWWDRPSAYSGAQMTRKSRRCGTIQNRDGLAPGDRLMRAMQLSAQAPILEAPLAPTAVIAPEPSPGEIRVRVHACATCRTDLHVIEGDLSPRRLPLIPGHQAVGIVEARAAGATRFADGDRVGIAWLRSTCGVCRYCTGGRENLCESSTYTGWTHDGGYAESLCVP